jgi:integrase
MGLGDANLIGLAEARERGMAARRLVLDGIDPIEARRDERAKQKAQQATRITFRDAAAAFLRDFGSQWGEKHAAQAVAFLTRYSAPLDDRMVDTIETPDVLRVLDKYADRAVTRDRLRSRIADVMDWCTARGYRSGDNPAAKAIVKKALPGRRAAKVEHLAALPYVDVPALVRILRKRDTIGANALAFTIMTAARSGEALGARWDEFDLDNATWTIPAPRMKARREHRVPLAPSVVELLRRLPTEDSSFVFVAPDRTGEHLCSSTMNAIIRRAGRGITVHGFRSSFRDWASEQTAFAHDVVEAALAHVVGSQTERAYKRTDLFERRRKLMEAWAAFCLTPAAATGEVVAIKRRIPLVRA